MRPSDEPTRLLLHSYICSCTDFKMAELLRHLSTWTEPLAWFLAFPHINILGAPRQSFVLGQALNGLVWVPPKYWPHPCFSCRPLRSACSEIQPWICSQPQSLFNLKQNKTKISAHVTFLETGHKSGANKQPKSNIAHLSHLCTVFWGTLTHKNSVVIKVKGRAHTTADKQAGPQLLVEVSCLSNNTEKTKWAFFCARRAAALVD